MKSSRKSSKKSMRKRKKLNQTLIPSRSIGIRQFEHAVELSPAGDIVIKTNPQGYDPKRPIRVALKHHPTSIYARIINDAVLQQKKNPVSQMVVVRHYSYDFTGDVLARFEASPKLMIMVRDGGYIYANGRFCLPSCITLNEKGQAFIRKAAWSHPKDYFLSWESKYRVSIPRNTTKYRPRAKRIPGGELIHAGLLDIDTISQEEFKVVLKTTGGGGSGGPLFHELLKHYMNTAGMSAGVLADEVGLDESTIKRYLRGAYKQTPEMPILVALCIAMHLFPMCSMELLTSAGRTLSCTEIDNAYWLLLNSCYMYSVHRCNLFLIRMGYPPLTKK